MARVLIAVGLALVALGLLPLGRLPGDLRLEREGFRLYLPFATCIALSVVAAVVCG